MTRLGLVVVTVVVGVVLVGVTWMGVRYLVPPAAKAEVPAASPLPPEIVRTPSAGPGAETALANESDEPPASSVVEIPASTTVQPLQGAGSVATTPAAMGGAAASEAGEAGLAAARAGQLVEAQKRLTEAVRQGASGPRAAEYGRTLNDVTDRLLTGSTVPAGYPYIKSYTVESGDALASIGRQFFVPYELVMKMNRLASDRINVGQTLRVLQGPIHIEVFKSRFQLQVWCDAVCLKVYPVAIGKENSTPEGVFVVLKKIKNPPYQPQHKPASAFRDAGAPDNPLGTRWIDLGSGYGIHGTIEPQSIGTSASEGCIRMLNENVEEVYDLLVPKSSKVTIHP